MSIEASNIRNETTDLLLSVQELKDIFLFGIDMTDDNGEPFPERMFEFHIRSAQQWIEKEIGGLSLGRQKIMRETHDFYANDWRSWNFLKLYRFPVLSVERISFDLAGYAGTGAASFPFNPAWFRIDSAGAQVNLVPTIGSIHDMVSRAGANWPSIARGDLPHSISVDYTAGFEKGKVPDQIREIIGMKAAMGPLNVAGDLIAGAGIANKSISLDGMSQSIGTTSSATNAGYGARILTYEKEIKSRMANLKSYYGGIGMVVA